jgi:hypothetical protein
LTFIAFEEFGDKPARSSHKDYLAYSLILHMEATLSSKMSVDLQLTASHYIAEYRTLHNHC